MAGINLVRQLKRTQAKERAAAAGGGGLGGLANLKAKLDDLVERIKGGAEFDRQDAFRLALMLLGIFILAGSRFFLDDYHQKAETEIHEQIKGVDEQIAIQTKKLKELKDLIAESEALEKQIQELKRKLGLIEQVIKNRNAPVKMVDFVISEMPESVWLEKMDLDPKDGGKVDVNGYALSLQLVSEFIRKLEGAVFFPNWQLIEGAEDTASTRNPVSNTSQAKVATGALPGTPTVESRPPGTKKFAITARVSPK